MGPEVPAGNGDMSATKKVVREKAEAARDLIKCHPLSPELATELFASKGSGAFRFSAALIEWSKSELDSLQKIWVQAYKNAWQMTWGTRGTGTPRQGSLSGDVRR